MNTFSSANSLQERTIILGAIVNPQRPCLKLILVIYEEKGKEQRTTLDHYK